MNAVARIFHVSTLSVLRCIRDLAEKIYEKPKLGDAVLVELDKK
jgi:hypothetical protein